MLLYELQDIVISVEPGPLNVVKALAGLVYHILFVLLHFLDVVEN